MTKYHMVLPFVIAYIENEKGEVLVGRQPDQKNKPFPNFWDAPGGKLEPDESIEECLIREIREETGFIIEEKELVCTYHNYPKIYHKDYKGDIPSVAICYKVSVSGDFNPSEMEDMGFLNKKALKKLKFTPWTEHLLKTMSAI